MKQYSIGEVAKTLNISVQAIRLYQEKGLIEPSFIDPSTKYRYFDEEEAAKIWRIKILQSAGFELSEIKKLDDSTLEDIESQIQEKLNTLQEVIEQKRLASRYLERQLFGIDKYKSVHEIEIKWIDNRYGICFAEEARYDLMSHLGDLSNLKGIYGVNQEVCYEPTSRFKVIGNDLVLQDLFAVQSEEDVNSTVQPKGWYACVYVKKEEDIGKHFDNIQKLIKEKGYTLRGDALASILINNNLVNSSKYNLIELQVALIKN